MEKSAIVILNWNGRAYLEKYLPGVVASVRDLPDVEVVVADNCSTDDSVLFLQRQFPTVRVLALDRNYGFAGGYDIALRMIDAEIFVLLNSDVEVQDGWFEPLEEWFRLHSDCGICGPKLLSIEHRDTFEYAGAAGGYLDKYGYPLCKGRTMDLVEKDEGQYDLPGEVFWISGAALAVRRNVFLELGGFREDFFMHMEEIDLCWRARLSGYKVHAVPRSKVYHLGGGTLAEGSPSKTFYNHRNNLLMLHSNLPMTFAIFSGLEMLASVSDQNEGPDFFGNCYDAFLSLDGVRRQKFCEAAVRSGRFSTRILLFKRRILDVLAAFVYLIQGRPACFMSVMRARRAFRHMRDRIDYTQMQDALMEIFSGDCRDTVNVMIAEGMNDGLVGGEYVSIKCMPDIWVAAARYLKKRSIFADGNI